MADPVYALGIEFVAGSFTNVTSTCLEAQVDRQLGTADESLRSGHAMFTLVNDDSRFSPQNSASPYYPNLIPGRRVRLEATHRQNYLSLPGSDGNFGNFASAPYAAAFDVTGDWEVEVTCTPSGDQQGSAGLLSRVYPDGNTKIPYVVGFNNGGGPLFPWVGMNNGNWFTLVASAAVASGAEVTVKGVHQGSGFAIYVNGTLSNSVGGIPSTTPADSGSGIRVGRRWDLDNYFRGKIRRATVRNGVGGPLVADFNAEDTSPGQVVFESKVTGEVWTLSQSGSVKAEILTESTSSYPLFNGRLTRVELDPSWGNRSALFEAGDDLDRMRNTYATTSLFQNTNASSLFTSLMSISAVGSFAVDSENSINDSIPFAWSDDEQVTTAIGRLLSAGNYASYVDGGGTVRLLSRHFRQGAASVATYSALLGDPGFDRLQLTMTQDTVRNRINISGQPRVVRSAVGTVAWLRDIISIAASASAGFVLNYVDTDDPNTQAPATGIITPAPTSDWALNTASDGGGTDKTSTGSLQFTTFGASAVCSLFNGSGVTVYVTQFRVRGQSAQQQPVLSSKQENGSSQAVYGRRDYTLQNDLLSNQSYIDSYTQYLLLLARDPVPQLQFGLRNRFPDALARELGDVVSLVESATGVNSQWQVTGVTHEISLNSGLEHAVMYQVRQHPDYGWFVLDDAAKGLLDANNRLGF